MLKTGTTPELVLRRALWAQGLRFRVKNHLPGTPDLFFAGLVLPSSSMGVSGTGVRTTGRSRPPTARTGCPSSGGTRTATSAQHRCFGTKVGLSFGSGSTRSPATWTPWFSLCAKPSSAIPAASATRSSACPADDDRAFPNPNADGPPDAAVRSDVSVPRTAWLTPSRAPRRPACDGTRDESCMGTAG